MEQDLTLLTTEDICTPDNEPEETSSAPRCNSPSVPKDTRPGTETPRKGQDEHAKGTAPKLLRSYQFKIDLPTVVDVCSVVQIFEKLPVKIIGFRCCGQKGFGFVEVVPIDDAMTDVIVIEKTQSEAIRGRKLYTRKITGKEKIYTIEETMKLSHLSREDQIYGGCVICGKQHFSQNCPQLECNKSRTLDNSLYMKFVGDRKLSSSGGRYDKRTSSPSPERRSHDSYRNRDNDRSQHSTTRDKHHSHYHSSRSRSRSRSRGHDDRDRSRNKYRSISRSRSRSRSGSRDKNKSRKRSRSRSRSFDKTKPVIERKESLPPSLPQSPSPLVCPKNPVGMLRGCSSPSPLPVPPPFPSLQNDQINTSNTSPTTVEIDNIIPEYIPSSLLSPKDSEKSEPNTSDIDNSSNSSNNNNDNNSGDNYKDMDDDNKGIHVTAEVEEYVIKRYLEQQRARTTVDLSLHDDEFYLDFGKRVFSLLLQPNELHLFLDKQAEIVRSNHYSSSSSSSSSSSCDPQPPSPKRRKDF